MAEDHYETLGVPRTASAEDIRKAYRELARKYHPDLHPDDAAAKEKFKKVQTAFDVLNDQSKREMYDRYGSSFEGVGAGGQGGGWAGGGGGRGPFPGAGGFPGGGEIDLESLFGGAGGFADMFRGTGAGGAGARGAGAGRGRKRAAQVAGEDITARIEVPFKLAIEGGKTDVRLDRDGKAETISVTIPQGLPDGARMRLRGQGLPGSGGGPAGDLLLEVRVESHPVFHRDGDTLEVTLPVSLAEAIEGAKVDVPTPWGTISLRIPAGTSGGRKLRAQGMGVRHANGAKGDLIAEVQIMLPESADPEALAQLLAAAKVAAGAAAPRAQLRW